MLVLGGIIACGALWWLNQDSEPARPVVRRLSETATESEKLEDVLTTKARKIIDLQGDVLVQPGKSYRSREIHCSLINKKVSWDDVIKDFEAFSLKEEDVSEASDADKQISDWATSIILEIKSFQELNKKREYFKSEIERRPSKIHECTNLLKTGVRKIAVTIDKQLKETEDSTIERYTEYRKLLQETTEKERWLTLISFVYTETCLSQKGLQLFINSPTTVVTTEQFTSDEEFVQKMLQDKTESAPVALATAVIKSKGEATMRKTEYFGHKICCFPTGFVSTIEAPTSTEGRDFRKAVERTTATLDAEASERYKLRSSFFGREGGATWSKAPEKVTEAVVYTRSNFLTQEMDRFLDSVDPVT